MGRIGILGGTFNPIHNGHLHIARCFAESLSLDRVVLLPSKRPTHKEADDLASSEHRLAMCRLASEGTSFIVSDLEITRQSASYTVYTVETLSEQYPDDALYFLMGEDMFLTFCEWFEPERIVQKAILCAAPRSEDGRARLEEYGANITAMGGRYQIVPIPFLPISSTEVRERLGAGQEISDLVPPKVAQYLKTHRLYTGGRRNDKSRV